MLDEEKNPQEPENKPDEGQGEDKPAEGQPDQSA